MPPVTTTIHPQEVDRLAIAVGAGFEDFRARYERSVPTVDPEQFAALVRRGADWETVLRASADNAPHHFIRYWTHDSGALMQLDGNAPRSSSYLMGNHMLAERMYRRDPAVMLYAPMRTAIHEDADGATWFSFDQPSTRFESFGDPTIAEVGLELDRKVAMLLDHLGAPVSPALTR
jgi:hypothetical protein